MSPRFVGVLAALASVVGVLAQDVAPQWTGFHTWQYVATLGIGAVAIGGYALAGRRGEDGMVGARLVVAMVGALVVIAAGIASGLLGPDTEIVSRAPGTVAPLGDVGAAAFFPIADAAAIARGDGHVLLQRRGAGPIDVSPGERRFVGATVVELVPRAAAYVEARTTTGDHLTITQPTNPAFLSPVLLFTQQIALAGKMLPADTFAIPALHRQVKAFYFASGAPGATGAAHGQPTGAASVLFAVDDDDGRLVSGGIGFAPAGQSVDLGGLRLRATLGSYPTLAISAVPLTPALVLGCALLVAGFAWAFGRTPKSVTQRTPDPTA
jgi:hypothetical protein